MVRSPLLALGAASLMLLYAVFHIWQRGLLRAPYTSFTWQEGVALIAIAFMAFLGAGKERWGRRSGLIPARGANARFALFLLLGLVAALIFARQMQNYYDSAFKLYGVELDNTP